MSDTVTTQRPTDELEELEEGTLPAELPAGDDEKSLPEPDLEELAPPDEGAQDTSQEDDDEESGLVASVKDPASLQALQGVINRQSAKLDELKEETKKLNESLKSILENDQELAAIETQALEATRKQKERKQMLSNNAESVQIRLKVKEIKENIKDLEESLNNHLLNYYNMTGVKVFDTDDGAQREFDVRARLRGKKKAA